MNPPRPRPARQVSPTWRAGSVGNNTTPPPVTQDSHTTAHIFAVGSSNTLYNLDGDYATGKWSAVNTVDGNYSTGTWSSVMSVPGGAAGVGYRSAAAIGSTVHLYFTGSDNTLYNIDADYGTGTWSGVNHLPGGAAGLGAIATSVS